MLACHDLALEVPGRMLCRGLNFTVETGQTWAVLGPNGSGKTTLLHTMAGLHGAAAGTVSMDGVGLESRPARERACDLGLLLQLESTEFWGSVLDYVLLGRFARARSRFRWTAEDEASAVSALQDVGLGPLAGHRYAELSGGERQRARIAQLLAQAPRLLLLDEPLQHLDLKHQVRALELFARWGRSDSRAVVMVLHDLLWPGHCCTHALLLDGNGGVLCGAAGEVLKRDNLERAYGCALAEPGDLQRACFIPHV